jgi:hypothetical protein
MEERKSIRNCKFIQLIATRRAVRIVVRDSTVDGWNGTALGDVGLTGPRHLRAAQLDPMLGTAEACLSLCLAKLAAQR